MTPLVTKLRRHALVLLAVEGVKLAMIGAAVVKVADKVDDLRRWRAVRDERRHIDAMADEAPRPAWHPSYPGPAPWESVELVDVDDERCAAPRMGLPDGECAAAFGECDGPCPAGPADLVPYDERPLTPAEIVAQHNANREAFGRLPAAMVDQLEQDGLTLPVLEDADDAED